MAIVPELEITAGMYLEMKTFTHLDGQLGENVHYAVVSEIASTATSRNPGVLADKLSAWFATPLKALICTPATYLGMSMRVFDETVPIVKWATIWTKQGAGVGTAGVTPCPKQVCGLMSKRTRQAGRKQQGRTFVPFPATADVEPGGNPTASYLTRLQSYANAIDGTEFLGTVGDENVGVTFGLYTWRLPDSFRPTESIVIRDAFATQQRRGDYGKLNAIPDELK